MLAEHGRCVVHRGVAGGPVRAARGNARGLRTAALLHTADVRSVHGGCTSCMPGVLAGHSPLVAEVLDLCCKASRELCSVKTVNLLDTADTIQQPATHHNTHNTQEQLWVCTSVTNCLCMHAAIDSTAPTIDSCAGATGVGKGGPSCQQKLDQQCYVEAPQHSLAVEGIWVVAVHRAQPDASDHHPLRGVPRRRRPDCDTCSSQLQWQVWQSAQNTCRKG